MSRSVEMLAQDLRNGLGVNITVPSGSKSAAAPPFWQTHRLSPLIADGHRTGESRSRDLQRSLTISTPCLEIEISANVQIGAVRMRVRSIGFNQIAG